MGIIGGTLGYRLLNRLSFQQGFLGEAGSIYENRGKLDVFFGDAIQHDLLDKVGLDFGCGEGREAVQIAQRGARYVIGVDAR